MAEAHAFNQDPDDLVLRYLEDPRPDLKDMIMIQYAGLVERMARRFTGLEAHEDLVQVGFIGLLNALSKFDASAGVRFNTYATHLVAGEIKHYLRDRAQTIRQPAWLQELRHRVNKAAGVLQASLGRPPSEQEIAGELGVTEQAVREVFATQELLKLASLDVAPPGEEDGSESDNLDAAAFCPEQLSVEDRVLLESAMQQLRDLERDVLMLFHFDSMNQTEIAHRLGISCNYVSHILRQSLGKLRRILANEEEQDRLLKNQANLVDEKIIDPVTGIYSEDYFRTRFEEEIHRAHSGEGVLSLIILQFTGLERMAGFYGEASVRDFLLDAAEFVKTVVRRLDIVCRYEQGFAIILPSTGPSTTIVRQRLAQRMQNWVQTKQGPPGAVIAHLGHAIFPDDATSTKELLSMALPTTEIAMKAATDMAA